MKTPRNISASQGKIPAFSVLLIMAALTVIGVAMLPMLNIQYTPTVNERKINVSFSLPDASARLIEQTVTSRIEGTLSTIDGCVNVSSRSSKGRGSITIKFRKGTDMAAARFEVASAIRNLYSKLPDEVSYPEISLATSGNRESATMVYTIKADLPSERIEEYVSAYISTPLSQINGVGAVTLSGVTPYEWVITFDPRAMEPAEITATNLASAFNDYFRNDVIGLTTLPQSDGSERSIVLKLRNKASFDFGEIPVANRNGRIYYLRDFASVRWREALPSGYFRINGLNTINLSVTCEAHTNMLRVVAKVKEEMARLQGAFPPELSATLTYDASEYVSGELQKIYYRTLLCVAILLLFVYLISRDLRYLFIIMVTLAVNILVAVVFYNLLHLDIHIYTLAGITVSLGIIIDTSIIMVDHYSYYHDRRVFVSILGALLTTIGALGIVWLLPEEQQANLTDFSLVIIINLVVSLLVAVLFIPSLLDKFPLEKSMTASTMSMKRLSVRLTQKYGLFVMWGRRHRWVFIVMLIWGFGIPTFLLPDKIEAKKNKQLSKSAELYNNIMNWRFIALHRNMIDKVLGSSLNQFNSAISRYNNFREPEQKRLYVNAGMAEGCTVQQLNEVVRHMENYISQFEEIDMFITRITSYDNAQIEITFKPKVALGGFPSMLKKELTSAAINFGGATWRIWGIDETSFNNNVVSSYRPNQIRLRGYNYDKLTEFTDRLIDSISKKRRVSEPEIMDGDAWTLPHNEFNIHYEEEQIAAVGLVVADYFNMLHTKLYKSRLSSVYHENELQQVILESGERDKFDKWFIINGQTNIDSLRTKLSAVGTIEKQRSGISIRRNNQSYEMLVGFDYIGSFESAKKMIERFVDQLNNEILPIGFHADSPRYNGSKEKEKEIWLIVLVIAIIYTMCAIIFESLRKPVVIILMIPISFIGVFLTFGWSDFVFDQGGFAAFVLLCGIVVNAGIYLINEMDNWRVSSNKKEISLYLKAFNHKIIPISLTILSTILGLIPFLYDGPEEVFWFAFAVAAISGTLFSVIALAIFLPVFLPMRHKPRKIL